MPEVSVIIPCFNNQSSIKKTIDSLRNQSYNDFECILIDDHSMDGTYEMVNEYISIDHRFQCHRRTRRLKGANSCRNEGLSLSVSPYIIFLDADDILLSHCLKTRLQAFTKHNNLQALFFNSWINYRSRATIICFNSYSRDPKKSFLSGIYPWHTTGGIWKRSYLLESFPWDESLMRLQDVDFHIHLLPKHHFDYKHYVLTEPDHIYYRDEAQVVSQQRVSNIKNGYEAFLNKYASIGQNRNLLFFTYLRYVQEMMVLKQEVQPATVYFENLDAFEKLRLVLVQSNNHFARALVKLSHFGFIMHSLERLLLTFLFKSPKEL